MLADCSPRTCPSRRVGAPLSAPVIQSPNFPAHAHKAAALSEESAMQRMHKGLPRGGGRGDRGWLAAHVLDEVHPRVARHVGAPACAALCTRESQRIDWNRRTQRSSAQEEEAGKVAPRGRHRRCTAAVGQRACSGKGAHQNGDRGTATLQRRCPRDAALRDASRCLAFHGTRPVGTDSALREKAERGAVLWKAR